MNNRLKTNKFLESLMLSSQSSVNTDAVSYIGKEVTAAGVQADLKDGGATWAYNAQAQAASAIVTIKDAQGNVVYSETGSLAQGPGNFLWDGKGSDGTIKPDGTYTISIDGKNLAGQNVAISTSTTGIVSGVDFSGAEPVLTVGQSKAQAVVRNQCENRRDRNDVRRSQQLNLTQNRSTAIELRREYLLTAL
ncbi:FlgD immunoglobulin-like domain containing protein [Devosia algicola]|uniref:FlgD immunoglobulin-like domain containing protein n=1 Tax=Devosia algicola TaxID=3026418 RepID=A0ABY7YSF7_9HYPH|nr:FlgD immunoglobulin-like domain containing protein [Devosia algicola]WDR04189.1 FlgD immunoglobulin-like domain containing protein [Devosia algicola]